MMISKRLLVSLTALSILMLSGCAAPRKNPLLEEARTEFSEAESDPNIAARAPVQLKEAEETLNQAENLWKNNADPEVVSHYAYLAKQKTALARERTELAAAEEEIKKGEVARQQVMLDVRTKEAKTLAERAEQLQRELGELKAQQTERGLVLTLSDVLFEFDKATLKPGAQRTMDKLNEFLQEYPNRTVLIEGFTDSVGSETYNLGLSQRRAEAVKDALLMRGIQSDRIMTRGYGEQYPVANNDSAAGRQLNRRVEIVLSDESGQIPTR